MVKRRRSVRYDGGIFSSKEENEYNNAQKELDKAVNIRDKILIEEETTLKKISEEIKNDKGKFDGIPGEDVTYNDKIVKSLKTIKNEEAEIKKNKDFISTTKKIRNTN